MQAYMVVYSKRQRMVFVAFKKITGHRFGGRPTEPSLLNYGGQLVFPGGGAEGDDGKAAALREFFEETGIDLNKYIDGDKFQTVTFEGGSYSATYAEIDDDYMTALVENTNTNVHHKSTLDDELYQLGFLDVLAAYSALSTWDSSLTTAAAEAALRRRSKYSLDKSWFKAIMNHLLGILNAH